jgi:hypothetical protein
MYICRFASGITNTYFATELHLDPFYISYINIFNLSGIIIGVIIACCMVLQKKNTVYLGTGFSDVVAVSCTDVLFI